MMTKPDFEKKQFLFAFLHEGEKVSFSNDNAVVKTKEGKVKYQVTCYRLFALCIIGHLSLTSGIIQRAHKFGFSIILMTPSMRIIDVIGAYMEGNILLHRKQYAHDDLSLGRYIILNKIRNQSLLLKKIRGKSISLKQAISLLETYIEALKDDSELTLEQIMGYEGMAARVYFQSIFENEVLWTGRRPRIKEDYINSTLDIGYTVLFNFIDVLLRIYGFDSYCGVLHRQFYMRKSLVCDLVEPFRVLIDWQVRKSIHLHQCVEDDFEVFNHRYTLKWKENAKYIKFLMEPLMEHKSEIFEYIQLYYRAFMKEKKASDFPIYEFT